MGLVNGMSAGRLAVVLMVSACGRIAFDPVGAGSDADTSNDGERRTTFVFRDGLDGYDGTVDTFIDMAAVTTAYQGADNFFWHDDSAATMSQQHGLIRFDAIFAAGAIPVGARIVSAALRLVINDACAGPAGSVSETTFEWDGVVTWNTFGLTPGVQPEDLRTAPVFAAPMTLGANTVDVKASLAAWSADPTLNNGWIVSPSPMNGDACRVWSSQVVDDLSKPELTVVIE